RCLLEDSGGAKTCRVIGIAFDLCWPSFMALDDEPRRVAVDGHGCRIVKRIPRHDLRRRVDVRNDLPIGLANASAQPGERHAGAEELHKVTPCEWIRWRCDVPREFRAIVVGLHRTR